jgi:hypothetical protein
MCPEMKNLNKKIGYIDLYDNDLYGFKKTITKLSDNK